MNQPKYSPEEGFERLRLWCDRQERCVQEARRKLHSWGFGTETITTWLDQLIEDGILDEVRFAHAYVSGKFRIKRWGRRKIQAELQFRGIPSATIRAALATIDEGEYRDALHLLASRRLPQGSENSRKEQGNAARYLIGKGYEPELVWQTISELPTA